SELGTRNSELEQSDAVRLFVARAAAAQPAFALTDATAPAVATICQRLDGIPLAIELAAARTRILTPEQIAARLDERFRLLTGGSPDAPSRHQTLRLALDWSYDLLSEPEQRLLQRLSVFAGGCDLDAAEVVCAVDDPSADPSPTRRGKAHSTAVDQAPPSLRGKGAEGLGRSALVDLLTSLVDKSLVTLDYRGEAARYRLLETVRQYAVERLAASGEAESLRRRHGVWALDLAERAASLLDGPDQTDWLDQLDAEHDNLRAALAWALDSGEGTLGLQLAGALAAFWEFRGHLAEGRRWLTLALVAGRIAPPAIRTRAAGGAGNLARMQGDLTAARALYEESLDFARAEGDRAATALALNQLGIVSLFEGDFTAARTLFEQSLTIRRAIGDTFGMARTLNNLGLLAREQGDIATARTFYEQSMPLMRAAGDRRGVAGVLLNLGTIARDQGDLAAARSLLQESLSLFGERGDKASVSAVLNNLAVVVTEQGDFAEATSLHHQSLTLKQELGDRSGIAHSLEELAWIAARSGTPERAARLFGVAEALRHAIGTPLAPIERERHDRAVTDVRGTLAGPVFAAGWAEGAAMSPDDAIAYALANTGPPAPSPLPIPSPGES
ncbi:MAG: ATP-binding protein, partial [Dehalococcoidia bacterium]